MSVTYAAEEHYMVVFQLFISVSLHRLQELVTVSQSDMYAKLVSTCLDYSVNELNR